MSKESQMVIYKSDTNQIEVSVQLYKDTVWLNQSEISLLFERVQSVISRHFNNVFQERELDKKSNMQKMHIANSDKPVAYYSLDVIISVGYRVKSQQGTRFRIWANGVLKEYLIKGYAINERKLAQKEQEIRMLKDGIHILTRAASIAVEKKTSDNAILETFAKGLRLLDDYDYEQLDTRGLTKKEARFHSLKDYQTIVIAMLQNLVMMCLAKKKTKVLKVP